MFKFPAAKLLKISDLTKFFGHFFHSFNVIYDTTFSGTFYDPGRPSERR